jgi:hypothetical protein
VFDLDFDGSGGGPEDGTSHLQGLEELGLEEGGERLGGELFDDDGGEEDAHALVAGAGAGREEEGRGESTVDELLQRGLALAESDVIGQHVGQAGGVGEEVANGDFGAVALGEGWEVFGDGVFEVEEATIGEEHDGGGGHGLGDGGDQELRVGPGEAEGAFEDFAALLDMENGGFELAGVDGLFEDRLGEAEAAGGEEGGGEEGAARIRWHEGDFTAIGGGSGGLFWVENGLICGLSHFGSPLFSDIPGLNLYIRRFAGGAAPGAPPAWTHFDCRRGICGFQRTRATVPRWLSAKREGRLYDGKRACLLRQTGPDDFIISRCQADFGVSGSVVLCLQWLSDF